MMAKNVNTIVFDLGGVLIDWNPMYVFENYFEDESQLEYFFRHVATFEWNEEQDAGVPLADATAQRIALFPEWEQPLIDFYGRWEEMLGGPIPGTVDLLEQLKKTKQYPLYALTNWSSETFPIALQRYEFLHWFDGRLVSGEEKLAKPDPAIFRLLLSRYALDPASTLYIDDNARNVAAAAKEGLQAVQFKNPEQLREVMTSLSLI